VSGETSTVPSRRAGLPLRAVRIEVVEGPDAGREFTSETETISIGTAEGNDIRLSDPTVSRYHLELRRKGDRVLVADLGSTNGVALDKVLLERGSIAPGVVLEIGSTRLRISDGRTVVIDLPDADGVEDLRGRSPVMRRLMERIQKVAATDIPVLICGESGTGKELTARALHSLSPRAQKPFVTVDCGALTPSLIQSELFGHERGAFTGADRRRVGAFEEANGGTLFLDEVGELAPAVQATLLGALERRRFKRVGGSAEVSIDVRVVSATNRELRADVNSGAFRLDLFYRLAVTVLTLPPLRERPEDVPLLVEDFLRQAGFEGPVEALFPPAVMEALALQRWDGNVRELRNAVEAALATGEIPGQAADRPQGPAPPGEETLMGRPYGEARESLLAEFERTYAKRLLERAQGNISQAARIARVDRTHLLRLLKRHGLR
jgi:DNA-binding NtrC family response regulator